MKRSLNYLFLVALTATLVGCGADEEQSKSIEELQAKVIELDATVKTLRTEVLKIEALQDQVDNLAVLLKKASTTAPSTEAGQDVPNSARGHETLKSREDMRTEANKRRLLLDEKALESRTTRVIESLWRRRPLEEVVGLLNKGNVLHPDGASWTLPRLEAFVREHNITRSAMP